MNWKNEFLKKKLTSKFLTVVYCTYGMGMGKILPVERLLRIWLNVKVEEDWAKLLYKSKFLAALEDPLKHTFTQWELVSEDQRLM